MIRDLTRSNQGYGEWQAKKSRTQVNKEKRKLIEQEVWVTIASLHPSHLHNQASTSIALTQFYRVFTGLKNGKAGRHLLEVSLLNVQALDSLGGYKRDTAFSKLSVTKSIILRLWLHFQVISVQNTCVTTDLIKLDLESLVAGLKARTPASYLTIHSSFLFNQAAH